MDPQKRREASRGACLSLQTLGGWNGRIFSSRSAYAVEKDLTFSPPPVSKKKKKKVWDETLGQKFTSFYSSIFSAWTTTGHRALSSRCSKQPSSVVTVWETLWEGCASPFPAEAEVGKNGPKNAESASFQRHYPSLSTTFITRTWGVIVALDQACLWAINFLPFALSTLSLLLPLLFPSLVCLSRVNTDMRVNHACSFHGKFSWLLDWGFSMFYLCVLPFLIDGLMAS